jgi:hypothetical protein
MVYGNKSMTQVEEKTDKSIITEDIYMKNNNKTSTESLREESLSTHVKASKSLSRIIARGHPVHIVDDI